MEQSPGHLAGSCTSCLAPAAPRQMPKRPAEELSNVPKAPDLLGLVLRHLDGHMAGIALG